MRTDYLTPDLYNKLYAYMTPENVLALRVALETGLRIDDVLGLYKNALQGRTLRGTAEKTGKKFKKVISEDLRQKLLRSGNSLFFFPHRTKPYKHRTRQAVWANMKKAAKLCGIELNAAPHSARKTYAVSVFHDKGINAAQDALQHDRLTTTMMYVFSDMLTREQTTNKCTINADIEMLAELIAERVAEKLQHRSSL